MVVHGRKPKIRHKNMTDGIAENNRCHGGWFSHLKEDQTENGLEQSHISDALCMKTSQKRKGQYSKSELLHAWQSFLDNQEKVLKSCQ